MSELQEAGDFVNVHHVVFEVLLLLKVAQLGQGVEANSEAVKARKVAGGPLKSR